MEGAPQIPGKEEKPKSSIAQKIKRWAKIGAVASVGLVGLDKIEENNRMNALEEDLKVGREQKIDSIMQVHKELGDFRDYEEMLSQAYINIENAKKEIIDIKNKSGLYKDIDETYASRKLRKLEEDLEYLKKEIIPQIIVMSPDSARQKIKNAHEKYDEQHEWMNKVVHSNEYKKRLEKEIGPKDVERFDRILERGLLHSRKNYLNSKDYNVLHGENVSDSHNAMAWFKPYEELVELPSSPPQGAESVGIHEFAHDLTQGDYLMTEKAKDLYTSSFNIDGVKEYLGNKFSPEKVLYYGDPTERDARKKVLEYDLEKLGVKKYKEEFTQEHYEKAIELMERGKLSEDSVEFIKMTKPEYFLQIMNEIAENKVVKDDNQNLA